MDTLQALMQAKEQYTAVYKKWIACEPWEDRAADLRHELDELNLQIEYLRYKLSCSGE